MATHQKNSSLGPPGPPAGVYVQELSVTSYSARLVWTVGVETDHGNPITSYDIEAETDYHPDDWTVLMTGRASNSLLITHYCLASRKWDICKQCRPGLDAANAASVCGVWSGSTLFA